MDTLAYCSQGQSSGYGRRIQGVCKGYAGGMQGVSGLIAWSFGNDSGTPCGLSG